MDTARFVRQYEERSTRRVRGCALPMWKDEFMTWAMDTKKYPEEEAKPWWEQMVNCLTVDRDHIARVGRLQLYVPGAATS